MTIPNPLPQSSSILQRLMAEMPESLSLDFMEEDGINFTVTSPLWAGRSSTDTVSAFVVDGVFVLSSTVSYIDQEVIDLSSYTIKEFVAYFKGKYGNLTFEVSLPASSSSTSGDYLSTALIEGAASFGSTTFTWSKFTNPNYSFFMSIALALNFGNQDIKSSLRQMDIRLANNKWIDFWGHVLGQDRLASEVGDDTTYRNRVQREVSSEKSNNFAIANLVSDSIGRSVRVIDGGVAFTLGGTNTGPSIASILPYLGNASGKGSVTGTNLLTIVADPTSAIPVPLGNFWDRVNGLTLYNIGSETNFSAGTTTIISPGSGSGGTGTYNISTTTNVSNILVGARVTGTNLTTVDEALRIGPETGSGSFLVYVQLAAGETLSQELSSLVYGLVNKWKPAGLSFAVKSYT